ncbi:hypothetical protein DUI87_28762 [Hirundo rustica rustica]|uniref:PDZ domain-containing protein n=1 Tax=Hirundo rustica rustica TaxID=333673 RepID=A0A3M0J7C5_HIRRU|nr:hypothetical protein DUI87_28762 [Hirundo rustica rustica]
MPAAAPASLAAMQQVLDNLMGLPGSPGVADLDLIFLRGIMESPIVRSWPSIWGSPPLPLPSRPRGSPQAHERLEERKLEAVRGDNLALVQEILRDIGRLARPDARAAAAELARILREPHFQSLLETHDSVAAKSYDPPPSSPGPEASLGSQPVPPDAVRMVGIRKAAGENLGVTFRVERGELVIARILHGGMVAQQGLLHVGDVIREVNGREVGSDPRALQDSLRHASGSVVLKILPSYQEPHPPRQDWLAEGALRCSSPPRASRPRLRGDKAALSPPWAVPWRPGAVAVPAAARPSRVPMCAIAGAALAALGTLVCLSVALGLCLGVAVVVAWGAAAAAGALCVCLSSVTLDYDPATDSLIPCKEAGLKFMAGDLLQIVNQDDPNWWQACHVEGGSAGLVPSQLLEEKRKAFVKRDGEVAPTSASAWKRKKRMMYLTNEERR